MKFCVFDEKMTCNLCGGCDDRCEIDPYKVCDNCFLCLETDTRDFAEIQITDILTEVDASAFELAPLAVDWPSAKVHARTMQGVKGSYKQRNP